MLDKRLLREARGHRDRFAVLIGLGLAGGMLAVLQAGVLTIIINGAFLEERDLASLKYWLALLLTVMAIRAAAAWAAGMSAHYLASTINTGIRRRLVDRLFAAGPVAMAAVPAGEIVNTIVQGVDNLEPYFARYIPQLAAAVLIPVLALVIAMPLDLTAAAIMAFTAPLIPVLMVLIGRLAERHNKRQWDKLAFLSAHFLDVLRGLTTLKLFHRSKEQTVVIARLSEEFRDTTLSVLKIAFLSSLVLELLTTIGIALIAVSVGLRLLYGQMDFNQAFFLLLLAPEFYRPLRQLGSHFHAGLAGKAAADSIFNLLQAQVMNNGGAERLNLTGPAEISIRFADVRFAYQSGNRPALNGVSFDIAAGTKVALVGASGAGKSTLIGLLLGFIEPAAGMITVNGISLDKLSRQEWLGNVAYVPQMPHLFSGTVADNIRMGNTADLDKVINAAKAAGAHDFISCLPDGYQTIIGEGGNELSGGERQRIAIARTFLRDAPFIILDEATASLDPFSEDIIKQALEKLFRGRTVLVIAHRLTTVAAADRIIVLEQGRIIESGTHTELLAKDGRYAQMATIHRRGVV